VEIPEGSHEVVFEFRPSTYFVGNTVTLISSLLTLLIFLAGVVLEFRKTNS